MEKLILLLSLFYITACAHGQCSNLPQRETATDSQKTTDAAAADVAAAPTQTVKVYKDTGEKQCGMGAGIAIEKMKETLTKNKIQVIEAKTQNDGKMHMTLCGSPSGQIHVFTIAKNQLKRATGLGFKLLP